MRRDESQVNGQAVTLTGRRVPGMLAGRNWRMIDDVDASEVGQQISRDGRDRSYATQVHPGQDAQVLHYDQGIYPLPRDHDVMLTAMWALDDFTADNGATRVVPGSHEPGRDKPGTGETVPVEMPAGSVLLFAGRLWHGAGANTSTRLRLGVIMSSPTAGAAAPASPGKLQLCQVLTPATLSPDSLTFLASAGGKLAGARVVLCAYARPLRLRNLPAHGKTRQAGSRPGS